ncbi:MAG: phosphatase PAP2 family protein [Gemmatimonadota bacterium]|nr:phosphatase PAP2 family protein [Gemmatimonadota bacterium]
MPRSTLLSATVIMMLGRKTALAVSISTFMLGVAPLTLTAQQPPPSGPPRDTVPPLFVAHDLYYAGAFVAGTVLMFPADKAIAKELQRPGTQANRFLSHLSTDFRLSAQPGALIIGGSLYAIGRVGHFDRVADLGLHGTEAILLGTGINYVLKGALGRARPYVVGDTNPHSFKFGRGFQKGNDYQSLPSGHTMAGFAAASAVTAETARWWPNSTWYIAPIMYGGATMIGLSRMYNNAHWASDVIMGAGVGTFAGIKVVQYNHAHPNNRLDRILLSTIVVPNGEGGVVVAWSMVP